METTFSLLSIFLLSVALAMDAFAVSVATGLRLCRVSGRQLFRLTFHFGLFQGLMPIMGWLAGMSVRSWIEDWDHWIAFGLLAWIGGKMLWESFQQDGQAGNEAGKNACDPTKGFSLVMLSVATSIDALAVGLSFSLLGVQVWMPALSIGVVCAVFTAGGLILGSRLAKAAFVGLWAERVGGLTLIAIGLKILWEHLSF